MSIIGPAITISNLVTPLLLVTQRFATFALALALCLLVQGQLLALHLFLFFIPISIIVSAFPLPVRSCGSTDVSIRERQTRQPRALSVVLGYWPQGKLLLALLVLWRRRGECSQVVQAHLPV
ncbi:hypothetical protein L226DRAFT_383768 [Lentinus tigrinus ALCF2SS1-7]|uniref:uncharacterized protein n=1 Tax=Lentinus tigrinus ALCF2SS1-7 TaxID=1328758 RepID=UPI0011663694|nr:hypothetical protein L226DRAFT_383768 [Lentinus tigrinus ALCF2SS1-7]